MTVAPLGPRGISVGQLRQNPTAMIHDVRLGAEYVLTDRGVPTARILPFRPRGWVGASRARMLLSTAAGDGWAEDLRAARLAESPRDPWAVSQ
jgi:antitoxin (DNA-binding transcriptional repressor) of toxin-antitoxin stability system